MSGAAAEVPPTMSHPKPSLRVNDDVAGVRIGIERDVRHLAAVVRLAAARRLARTGRSGSRRRRPATTAWGRGCETPPPPPPSAECRGRPTPSRVRGPGLEVRAADAGGVRLRGRIVDLQAVEPELRWQSDEPSSPDAAKNDIPATAMSWSSGWSPPPGRVARDGSHSAPAVRDDGRMRRSRGWASIESSTAGLSSGWLARRTSRCGRGRWPAPRATSWSRSTSIAPAVRW